MNKRKGFTLVEVLAVIVIIGVLALVVVPTVKNLINKSEEQTDLLSVKNYYNAADIYYNESKGNKEMMAKLDSNIISELEIDGPKASGGELYLSKAGEKKIALIFHNKCYTLAQGLDLKYIEISDDVDNCVAYTPASAFIYEHNNTDTGIIITGYKRGGYISIDSSYSGNIDYINNQLIQSDIKPKYAMAGTRKYIPGQAENVVVPPQIDGLPVVEIGDCAFYSKYTAKSYYGRRKSNRSFENNKAKLLRSDDIIFGYTPSLTSQYSVISSIILPDTIEKIGKFAFAGNKLTSISIPNNVKSIGVGAFSLSLFSRIDLPNTVTSIGAGAFAYSFIRDVTLPTTITSIPNFLFYQTLLSTFTIESNITSIGDYAFSGTDLENIIIPGNVKTVGNYAFNYSLLENVDIASGVTTIGTRAFNDCRIKNVNIPNTVTSMGKDAFYLNNLDSLVIDNSPIFSMNYPWGVDKSKISYLHGVNINVADAIKDSIVITAGSYGGKAAYNSTVTLQSNILFKQISAVTVDGTTYVGNSFTTIGSDDDMNITAITTSDTDEAIIETPHNYGNNEKYTWNFNDSTATSYTLIFSNDNLTESCDYVRIYNGIDGTGTELKEYSGSNMSGQTYTINSSTGSIVFTTDASVVYYGIKATLKKNR